MAKHDRWLSTRDGYARDMAKHERWHANYRFVHTFSNPRFDFDPLDVTKTWPEDLFPLQVIPQHSTAQHTLYSAKGLSLTPSNSLSTLSRWDEWFSIATPTTFSTRTSRFVHTSQTQPLVISPDLLTDGIYSKLIQIAFCPAIIVPGISYSEDKLLQTRIFSYADTQRHRLGPNYLMLPVNAPR